MLLYPENVIEDFYKVLTEQGIDREMKVLKYGSQDYPGYAYIKIYNREADKQHMIENLKEMLNIEQTMTFGSIKGRYDEVIQNGDMNRVVHVLKKKYEPLAWKI